MVADSLRVPFADHSLVKVPDGVDPLRVAAASDNLADAWRSVVPPLRLRPGGSVLVIGGGAQSIGLYAAGLARGHGASVVDYVDDRDERLEIADGPRRERQQGQPVPGQVDHRGDPAPLRRRRRGVVAGPGAPGRDPGAAPGRHLHGDRLLPGAEHEGPGHGHVRDQRHAERRDLPRPPGAGRAPRLRRHRPSFPAELVTSLLADWEEAPDAYRARTTKLVLHRAPLAPAAPADQEA